MNISAIPVPHVLKTATWITRLAYTIALIGIVGPYGTQVVLLAKHEVGVFSCMIPATIDLLAICAALALQLPGLDRAPRRIAGRRLRQGTCTIRRQAGRGRRGDQLGACERGVKLWVEGVA